MRFVSERVVECRLGILFAQEEVDRLRVADLDEGERTHGESLGLSEAARYCLNWLFAPAVQLMTSQGTPHGRFARAIRNRNLLNAEMAAREMGELSLPDALAFCLLLAQADPPRFDRAIARWHARFVLEAPGITADEAMLALLAAKGLRDLRTRDVAAHTLRRLAEQLGHRLVAETLHQTNVR